MGRSGSSGSAAHRAALYRSQLDGVCCPGGMSGIWDDFVGLVSKGGQTVTGTIDAKVARLERALTVITVLSGVAAAAAVLGLFRRRA